MYPELAERLGGTIAIPLEENQTFHWGLVCFCEKSFCCKNWIPAVAGGSGRDAHISLEGWELPWRPMGIYPVKVRENSSSRARSPSAFFPSWVAMFLPLLGPRRVMGNGHPQPCPPKTASSPVQIRVK